MYTLLLTLDTFAHFGVECHVLVALNKIRSHHPVALITLYSNRLSYPY